MGLAYPHCFLDCPEHHLIPIPHLSLEEIGSNPRRTTTDGPQVNVVCGVCGIVSAYSKQNVTGGLFEDKPSRFQADECRLVATQVECDVENCEAPKTVHAISENDKGIWRLSKNPEDWRFSDKARCGDGHKLHLAKSGTVLWVALSRLPF
jgi:hypothetical protein